MTEEFHLEEYRGEKFFVEHVEMIHQYAWFRIHMTNGIVHDVTVNAIDDMEEAKLEVIQEFHKFLDNK